MSSFDNITATAQALALSDAVKLVPGIIVESALFGFLSLLVIFSTINLLRQGMNTRPRIFMLAAIMIMYVASGTHWGLNTYTLMREIRDPPAWAALPIQTIYLWSVITTIALFFNFWISDMVVMWRACLLWEWNRYIVMTFATFICAPVVLAIINVSISHPSPSQNTFRPDIFGLLALIISLLSNVLATSLIGYKAWRHRRDIQNFLGSENTSSAVQGVLALLVESGLLYCILWTLFIVITVFNKGSFTHVAHTLSGAIPQLVGLYPAVIIMLVSLQKTHCDRNFTYDHAVESVMVAAVPRPQSSVVYSHHRRTVGTQGSVLVFRDLDAATDGQEHEEQADPGSKQVSLPPAVVLVGSSVAGSIIETSV